MNRNIQKSEVTLNGTQTKENEGIFKVRTHLWESGYSIVDTFGLIFLLAFLSSKRPGFFCVSIVLSFFWARKTRLSNLLLLQNLHHRHRKIARALLRKDWNRKRQQKSHEPISLRLSLAKFGSNCSIRCLSHSSSDIAQDYRASIASFDFSLQRSREKRANKAECKRWTRRC